MKRKYVWLLLCVMFMFAACGPQENDEKTESAAEVVADAGEEKTVQPDKEPEKEPEKTPEKPPADACTTYCDNVTTNCTGANKVYADKAACMAACIERSSKVGSCWGLSANDWLDDFAEYVC